VRASAQLVSYNPQDSLSSGINFQVNIPSSTASTGSGPVDFQLVAPKGTQWLGLGQGLTMSGANMFIMYAASSSNITLSPRSGEGHIQPPYNSAAKITLLEGTGISSDGVMTANVRCDSCINWGAGSMDPTSSSSPWIWSVKRGDALDTTDTSANLQQHDDKGSFYLNLPAGTGGSSANPFVSDASSASGSSAGASSTAVPPPNSTGGSGSSFTADSSSDRMAHGLIMSIAFLFLLPSFALTVYLPFPKKILFIHAPLQAVDIILLIAGLVLGLNLGRPIGFTAGYHQVIGYFVLGILFSLQPILGALQHRHYTRTGGRSIFGVFHQWLGRLAILLGIINGGLGFMQTGPVGSTYVPRWSVVAYGIVAGLMFLLYVAVVCGSGFIKQRAKRRAERRSESGYSLPSNPFTR
jgi:Cytochrome domain of cellobiose dehydrogenase